MKEWTVTKIVGGQKGKDGVFYELVWLEDERGLPNKTYLCKTHRNYKFWKGHLEVGAILTNLRMKEGLIDADSKPVRIVDESPKPVTRKASMDYGEAPKSRRLTHKLVCGGDHRWRCACGFTLGEGGHEALYARCKLFKGETAYAENAVSSDPTTGTSYAKPKRKARGTRTGISQAA